MRYLQLRSEHDALLYHDFGYSHGDRSTEFWAELELLPNISFRPSVTVESEFVGADPKALEIVAFHLGLIESISYWKCACPKQFIVRCGALNSEQIAWWKDLYLHGLSEFLYRNEIDFGADDFFQIRCESDVTFAPVLSQNLKGDLVLAAGGKDSSLTLELLKPSSERYVMALNPTPATSRSIEISGHHNIISCRRRIDPELIRLNKEGYLNGHTPFSAYLAFLSTGVAALNGTQNIVVSNESSADEASLILHQMPINHQYSKSFRFEKLFAEYNKDYYFPSCNYFSFLRPLTDLQISKLFSRHFRQLKSFRSCNANQRSDSWCGKCAKCAFVYLTLFPFTSAEERLEIFGADLFEHEQIVREISALTGHEGHKPFDCVGTEEESLVALSLVRDVYASSNEDMPPMMRSLIRSVDLPNNATITRALRRWNSSHRVPPDYLHILQQAYEG